MFLLFTCNAFTIDRPYKWYAGTTINELYDSAEEACQAYDMSSIGYPFLTYVGVNYLTESSVECLHEQTPGVHVGGLVGAGIRFVDYYIALPPMRCPPTEANPCNPVTGGKLQTEIDYSTTNKGLLVKRYYNSQDLNDGHKSLGIIWRHNYSNRMNGYGYPDYDNTAIKKSNFHLTQQLACESGWGEIASDITYLSNATAIYDNGICKVSSNGVILFNLPIHSVRSGRKDLDTSTSVRFYHFTRGNGTHVTFQKVDDIWKSFHPSLYTLHRSGLSWKLVDSAGNIEIYNSIGYLQSLTTSSGKITRFSYDSKGRLKTVTGHFGDNLTYYYNEESYLTAITTPEGDLNYSYDTQGRLSSVTYPDERQRHYHYEDTNRVYLLTGITDENGDRFATWAYDDQGRATFSEHTDGAEQTTFRYNTDGTTTVTDAVGAERTYHFIVKQGGIRVDHIDGDRCATCVNGGIKAYTYDSNGFVSSKTDWNGNVATYTRDSEGRALSRTEASGTPEARTVTTTWDTALNKPLVITEPERIIEYTYDTDGRLLSKQQRSHP
jgi:YD repeat-containing protein